MHTENDFAQFSSILGERGIHAALRFLNARTPHRYTGIYRYDGDVLRNEFLYDQFVPEGVKGGDVPMAQAYCASVGQQRSTVEFSDVHADDRIPVREGSAVVSYCGVMLADADGEPYGTLCHYDTKPCDARVSDRPFLEAAGPMIVERLRVSAPR